MESITLNMPVTVTSENISGLLCCAFEGGSNYWFGDLHVAKYPEGTSAVDYKWWHLEIPLVKGGALGLEDVEEGKQHKLTLAKIKKGLRIMADKYPWHWQNFRSDNADADTGDAFLQCCIFGDVIYG